MSEHGMDAENAFFWGVACTVLVVTLVLSSRESKQLSKFCPALIEHSADTLAIVQEFPECLRVVERGGDDE